MRVGVIYNPYLGQLFTARKGGGAYLNGRPIRVSSVGALHEGLVNVGTSPYIRTHAAEDFKLMHKVFLRCQDIRRCGAAALELAYVAAGCVEAFYDRDLKAWDYAAGKVILEEAGGRLTTVHGEETPPPARAAFWPPRSGTRGDAGTFARDAPVTQGRAPRQGAALTFVQRKQPA